MLKLGILTIGDEICIGQVINTNSAWIGKKCAELGCKIVIQSTIGDEKDIMLAETDRLLSACDIVLVTGGLGPTQDDITKGVLSDYFNTPLEKHAPTYDFLVERYEKRGIEINEANMTIAYLPKDCEVFENPVGTAPGMLFRKVDKILISMPGVPKEMKGLMEKYFLEIIKNELARRGENVQIFKTFQTAGIPESYLAELLGDTNSFINSGSLAYLPSYRGVRLRVGVEGDTSDKANSELKAIETYIREKAGKFIFGEGEVSLSSVVGRLLINKKKTVAVAESCTGGMLGAAFTDIPGSSEFFTGGAIVYSNEAKTSILGVKEDTLIEHGAVSEETALQLAENVREKFGTDFGIGITGIAGPGGGTEEKPVGTVWIGFADENGARASKYVFVTNREVNRELSVGRALWTLYERLLG